MTATALRSRRRAAHRGAIHVVAANPDYAQLCDGLRQRLGLAGQVTLQSLTPIVGRPPSPRPRPATLLVSRLSDLAPDALRRAGVGTATRQLVVLENLPVEAVAARLLPLHIRNPGRLHLAAPRGRAALEHLISRLLRGIANPAQDQMIVDAWIEQERLVLLSPQFQRLEIPLAKLVRFVGSDRTQAAEFEIDKDGRFLHWPHADVHLGWTQLQHLIDPASVAAARQESAPYRRRYGAAIRKLREAHGLTQAGIHGVTARHLRRVEHGEQIASKATLESLAGAHGLSLGDYVDQIAQRVAQRE